MWFISACIQKEIHRKMKCNITRHLITAPPVCPLHGYLFDKCTWVWVSHTRAEHQSPHPRRQAECWCQRTNLSLFYPTVAWRQETLFQSYPCWSWFWLSRAAGLCQQAFWHTQPCTCEKVETTGLFSQANIWSPLMTPFTQKGNHDKKSAGD